MNPEIRKPLIVGNWKMHGTIGESLQRATSLKNRLAEVMDKEIVVAPPFTALYSTTIALSESQLKVAAQNMHWEEEGAFTGEVSGRFIKDIGCSYVILGHSERRELFQETDATINLKMQAAAKNDLVPILCIGECLKVRKKNETLAWLENQLKSAFTEMTIHDFDNLVLAYEPIWAIGTGKNATAEQVGEVHEWLRHWLMHYFDAPTANHVRLLYGGSVKPGNAKELMEVAHVDGLLVGGASLEPQDFEKIIKF